MKAVYEFEGKTSSGISFRWSFLKKEIEVEDPIVGWVLPYPDISLVRRPRYYDITVSELKAIAIYCNKLDNDFEDTLNEIAMLHSGIKKDDTAIKGHWAELNRLAEIVTSTREMGMDTFIVFLDKLFPNKFITEAGRQAMINDLAFRCGIEPSILEHDMPELADECVKKMERYAYKNAAVQMSGDEE